MRGKIARGPLDGNPWKFVHVEEIYNRLINVQSLC